MFEDNPDTVLDATVNETESVSSENSDIEWTYVHMYLTWFLLFISCSLKPTSNSETTGS